ncbi:MAG: phosphotransferase [Anaerolineales bacterium]|nr:phosphotransferase [Anaerolineales bacterium]
MKPYDQLTCSGRLRRKRQLACLALTAYGLRDAPFKFVHQAGNTLYRVYDPHPTSHSITSPADPDLFEPGQYLLRLHQPGYQERAGIQLELEWLAAMRREAGLPVPEPVPALDGRLLVQVELPGIPQERDVSLLRWVKGSLPRRPGEHHYRQQGRLMAQMHHFSARWQPAIIPQKRIYDADGLFLREDSSGMPNREAWSLLPPEWAQPFAEVAGRTRGVMEAWGQGPQVFGLIHADLGVDANLFFYRGAARPIDFDDSGFGYWIYDLAVALENCRDAPAYPRYREALLEGYARERSLPAWQLEQLELFIAATQVFWLLWAVGGTHLYPQFLAEYQERIQRCAGLVLDFVRSAS